MRVVTKIGDIFSVKIDEDTKKYFQLIAFDLTVLNSDVIRAFRKVYPLDAKPDASEIVNGEVEFYAHCVTKWGVKMGLWEKAGKSPDVGELSHILFRHTEDYGNYPGKEPVKVSHNWYVWHINEEFKDVGKLTGKNRKAEIGLVMTVDDIVLRMKTGEYIGSEYYPDFE